MPQQNSFIKLSFLILFSIASFADSPTVDMSNCINCHGEKFEKSAIKTSRIVKELTEKEIYSALMGYKKESKGGAMQSVMMQQMEKFSEEQIMQLAKNIVDGNITIIENNSSKDTTTEKSESNQSEASMEVNTYGCMRCHGETFEKSAMGVSRIVNELSAIEIETILFNYKYNSVNSNIDALMAWQTAQLSDDEIKAIAKQIGK